MVRNDLLCNYLVGEQGHGHDDQVPDLIGVALPLLAEFKSVVDRPLLLLELTKTGKCLFWIQLRHHFDNAAAHAEKIVDFADFEASLLRWPLVERLGNYASLLYRLWHRDH